MPVGTDTSLHPDDVILSILALSRPEHGTFTSKPERIHTVFQELLQGASPDLRKFFRFAAHTPYPYSQRLDTSLANLQFARLLGMFNPDFRRYVVQEIARSAFEELVGPKLAGSPELEAELYQLSERFWQAMQTSVPVEPSAGAQAQRG